MEEKEIVNIGIIVHPGWSIDLSKDPEHYTKFGADKDIVYVAPAILPD